MGTSRCHLSLPPFFFPFCAAVIPSAVTSSLIHHQLIRRVMDVVLETARQASSLALNLKTIFSIIMLSGFVFIYLGREKKEKDSLRVPRSAPPSSSNTIAQVRQRRETKVIGQSAFVLLLMPSLNQLRPQLYISMRCCLSQSSSSSHHYKFNHRQGGGKS